MFPLWGSFAGVWKGMGYEDLGFGHVKFEMPVIHLRGDIEHSFRYMSLDFRRKVEAEHINLGSASIILIFKA